MFWKHAEKKAPAVVTTLGVFVWDDPFAWMCEHQQDGRTLSLMYMGHRFDPADMLRFEAALQHLQELSQTALAANRGEIGEEGHGLEQMTLVGLTIDPAEMDESFQLNFSFQKWPDGGLTVHFKDGQVTSSHIDD